MRLDESCWRAECSSFFKEETHKTANIYVGNWQNWSVRDSMTEMWLFLPQLAISDIGIYRKRDSYNCSEYDEPNNDKERRTGNYH